ncbi:acylphosphatase [Neptunomonas concharum]|uniref:Acylphosphatase n=1 Tax=Neptunomonas concharum TaxID=1031538 RepID=A0A5P1RAD2_9GAMM|nr:acylphosphatase [Neptunomonas concharum]QEQ96599.1 acylphosphatase [Neptunomonas concharum]
MAKICIHAWVSGRVQGVWFRQSTVEQAESLGVTGWVRNLPDGRVETMMYGEEKAVRQLESWLSSGPKLASVADVESEVLEYEEQHEGFLITG